MSQDSAHSAVPLHSDERRALLDTQRGTEITTEEAKQRLETAIYTSFREATDALITAPTSLGKTYTIASTPWRDHPTLTGGKPVVHISQTKEARDGAAKISRRAGVEYRVLKSRTERCPVARGDYDDSTAVQHEKPSEWFARKCDREGVSFTAAHERFAKLNGTPRCSTTGLCPAFEQYRSLNKSEDGSYAYDVIHATANFANLGNIISGANVVFDEQPTFSVDLLHDPFPLSFTRLFRERSSGTSTRYTWETFIETANKWARRETDAEHGKAEIEPYRELLETELTKDEKFGGRKSIHSLTPAVGRAILNARPVGNGRFTGSDGQVRVVFNDENRLRAVHSVPDLSRARCVLGMDAHPSQLLWKLNTGIEFETTELLTPDESQYWRTVERGLFVVQIGSYTHPLTSGWRNSEQESEVELLIAELHRKFPTDFRTCICPLSIKNDVENIMRASGIDFPDLMHYGNEKSLNDFKDERVGLLLGCIDPGDEGILDDLALLGLFAEPEQVRDEDDNLRLDAEDNPIRAYGRGFVGRDADAAAEFLHSVRETHVAQSIGRYARDARDNQNGALVYVWTNAIPDGLVDEHVPGVQARASPKRDGIIDCILNGKGPLTYRDIIDLFETREGESVTKKYVFEVCEELEAAGVIQISERTGAYGADEVHVVSHDLPTRVDLRIGGS